MHHVYLVGQSTKNLLGLDQRLQRAGARISCRTNIDDEIKLRSSLGPVIIILAPDPNQNVQSVMSDLPSLSTGYGGGILTVSRHAEENRNFRQGALDCIPPDIDPHILMAYCSRLLRYYQPLFELHKQCTELSTERLTLDAPAFQMPLSAQIIIQNDTDSSKLAASLQPLFSHIGTYQKLDPDARKPDLVIVDTASRPTYELRNIYNALSAPATKFLAAIHDQETASLVRCLDVGFDGMIATTSPTESNIARVKSVLDRIASERALYLHVNMQISASNRDPLTGVFNRRFLDVHLKRMLQKTGVSAKPFSLIMLDIDHFKHVNDAYGHSVGDDVLKQFVERVQKHLRPGHILSRLGGEEFLVVVPETNLQPAITIANRLRAKIGETPFFPDRLHHPITVTASIGVTSHSETSGRSKERYLSADDHDGIIQSLLDCADKALYEAKSMGRNRVQTHQCAA